MQTKFCTKRCGVAVCRQQGGLVKDCSACQEQTLQVEEVRVSERKGELKPQLTKESFNLGNYSQCLTVTRKINDDRWSVLLGAVCVVFTAVNIKNYNAWNKSLNEVLCLIFLDLFYKASHYKPINITVCSSLQTI